MHLFEKIPHRYICASKKNEMNQPYLIQRAKFKNSEDKGIDALLRFDYMGSSEFEWGALPKSLKRIRDGIADYNFFDHMFENGKVVNIFCKNNDKDEIGGWLEKLAKHELYLKEYCDLDDWINPDEFSRKETSDFWWDIDNDLFFWKKNYEFSLQLKNALAVK